MYQTNNFSGEVTDDICIVVDVNQTNNFNGEVTDDICIVVDVNQTTIRSTTTPKYRQSLKWNINQEKIAPTCWFLHHRDRLTIHIEIFQQYQEQSPLYLSYIILY